MSLPNLANGWTTTLAGSLTDVATSVDVAATAGIPARPFQAVILAEGANTDEIVTVSGLSGSTLTIARHTEANAVGSSSASAHASGATISHVLTAGSLTLMAASGTSFPASPTTGDRYFRTDLGLEFYWDGTRWLSCVEFALHGTLIDSLQPATGSLGLQYAVADKGPGDTGAWITRVQVATLVITTNDGSNYWTVKASTSSSNTTLGSTFTTAADTPSTWTRHQVAVGALLVSGDHEFRVDGSKTNAPGGLYALAAFFYRLVGT